MNCHRIQEMLLERLVGELPESDAAALDAHLASCPVCRAAESELKPAVAILKDVLSSETSASPRLSAERRSEVFRRKQPVPRAFLPDWLAQQHRWLRAAAGVAVVAGFFTILLRNMEQERAPVSSSIVETKERTDPLSAAAPSASEDVSAEPAKRELHSDTDGDVDVRSDRSATAHGATATRPASGHSEPGPAPGETSLLEPRYAREGMYAAGPGPAGPQTGGDLLLAAPNESSGYTAARDRPGLHPERASEPGTPAFPAAPVPSFDGPPEDPDTELAGGVLPAGAKDRRATFGMGLSTEALARTPNKSLPAPFGDMTGNRTQKDEEVHRARLKGDGYAAADAIDLGAGSHETAQKVALREDTKSIESVEPVLSAAAMAEAFAPPYVAGKLSDSLRTVTITVSLQSGVSFVPRHLELKPRAGVAVRRIAYQPEPATGGDDGGTLRREIWGGTGKAASGSQPAMRFELVVPENAPPEMPVADIVTFQPAATGVSYKKDVEAGTERVLATLSMAHVSQAVSSLRMGDAATLNVLVSGDGDVRVHLRPAASAEEAQIPPSEGADR